MALTPSTMLPLGTKAPDFTLSDPYEREVSLRGETAQAKACLIAFWCNHCPYVKHLKKDFARFADECRARGVAVLAINSNDLARYAEDSPQKMIEDIERYSYSFPYLVDPWQDVAKAYRAACTPDFFLFDSDLKLVYRGQYDESRPGNGKPVTGSDMRAAVDAVLAGRPVSERQVPSVGCNIKWAPGNEPDYFG